MSLADLAVLPAMCALTTVGVDARFGVEANKTDFFSSLIVSIVLRGLQRVQAIHKPVVPDYVSNTD